MLALGTGVGGGIVSDARVVRGPRGRAGEIGHTPVEAGGEQCGCGATGCLETVAGARALVRGGEAAVRRGEAPRLAGAGAVTPETVADAARRGDSGAQAVLDRAGTGIGRALASLAVALTPQVFVIGGGLAPALELMRPAIDAELDERAPLYGTIPVVRSTLGLHAGAIGAALWKDDSEPDTRLPHHLGPADRRGAVVVRRRAGAPRPRRRAGRRDRGGEPAVRRRDRR